MGQGRKAVQIKAATDEVNRTNAEREKEAQKMRKSMAGSLQQYEVCLMPSLQHRPKRLLAFLL